MSLPSSHEITPLLKAWTAGDKPALGKLTPVVYRQLHEAARRCVGGGRAGRGLQTTAPVNEVYLPLVDCVGDWKLAKVWLLRELGEET
jgi:ECF sigma factor